MADKRKNNGGNSTKSNKSTDKRKNKNKKLLDKYISDSFKYKDLKDVMNQLLKDAKAGDTKSSALFLAYILGKPIEFKEIDINSDGFTIIIE